MRNIARLLAIPVLVTLGGGLACASGDNSVSRQLNEVLEDAPTSTCVSREATAKSVTSLDSMSVPLKLLYDNFYCSGHELEISGQKLFDLVQAQDPAAILAYAYASFFGTTTEGALRADVRRKTLDYLQIDTLKDHAPALVLVSLIRDELGYDDEAIETPLIRAAELGDSSALYLVTQRSLESVSPDDPGAVELAETLRCLADDGWAPAANQIAFMYQTGYVVPKSEDLSFRYWSAAAASGMENAAKSIAISRKSSTDSAKLAQSLAYFNVAIDMGLSNLQPTRQSLLETVDHSVRERAGEIEAQHWRLMNEKQQRTFREFVRLVFFGKPTNCGLLS